MSELDMRNQTVVIHCVAEGVSGRWTGLCLNFDLAVQGASFREVHDALLEAIELYLESLKDYPVVERERLLRRRAPLWLRLRYAFRFFLASFRADSGKEDLHSFVEHTRCPA